MRFPHQLSLGIIVLTTIACTNFQEVDVPVGLSVSRNELSFSKGVEDLQLTISSGDIWEVANKPEWISLRSIERSGASPYEWIVIFTSLRNDEFNREGFVVIKTATETEKVVVTQEGSRGQYVPVESISLSSEQLTMTEGDVVTLDYSILPKNASIQGVNWASTSPSIAKVSNSGQIEAISAGSAIISITTEDGEKKASCNVTVKEKYIPVTSVSINKTNVTLTVEEQETLAATVFPSDATDKAIIWSSSNTRIASVEDGLVTALLAGETVITAMAGGKSSTCVVTVKDKPLITSISISNQSIQDFVGGQYTITPTITPSNARYNLEWSISDTRVVNLEQGSGIAVILRTKDYGIAEVTVKDKLSGLSDKLTVKTLVSDFVWKENTGETYSGYPLITIEEGEEYQLHYSCTPSSATRLFEDLSEVVFYENGVVVNAPSYISIDVNGKVKGLKAGTTGIKPTGRIVCDNSGGQQRVYFKVKSKAIPVTGISLNKTTLSLSSGDSETLYATITPSNATDQTVSWTSSNTSVATVSSAGLVTAKTVGNATITATTTDGGKKAMCSVTVTPISVTGVTLNKYSLSMYENDSETLIATVSPSNATNKNVSWSSNNISVATVSSYGQVQAKAAGEATITVTTEDGQIKATCAVTVAADPYGTVDLGLSVKWASFNYGASSITASGGYYFYGDPTGNAVIYSFTPPNVNSISGTQYDIVRKNWGGSWRIPTRSEINELYSLCTWTSTTLNGVSVLKVTGPSGASIYLPFTGCAFPADGPIGTTQIYDGNNAYMMSDNSYSDSNGRFVYVYYFTPSGQRNSISYRADFIKFPIRPVR